jgi:hypothetical protein
VPHLAINIGSGYHSSGLDPVVAGTALAVKKRFIAWNYVYLSPEVKLVYYADIRRY